MNDDHNAYYTDFLKTKNETLLAEHVKTNNTGVALCGSYNDEYIGDITTNTVFKISPHAVKGGELFDKTAVFDSIALILKPNGYLFGDSTKAIQLALHEITENYTLDSIIEPLDGTISGVIQLNNNTTTPFNPVPITTFSFIPEDIDKNVSVKLPDAIGQRWFNNINTEHPDYIIQDDDYDDPDFIENVLNGLTIRNTTLNNAVIGFKMATAAVSDSSSSTIRIYYHTSGPYTERYYDFKLFRPQYQYNQISADFSKGVLKGIEPGGEGISSTKTGGLTFVQSGLGLMTNVEITSLYELYLLGKNLTIIDLDLDFRAQPRSFRDNKHLPTVLSVDKLKKNMVINTNGLMDFADKAATVSKTFESDRDVTYSIPITRYGWDEQELLGVDDDYHNTLLIRGTQNGVYPGNINRLVLGDGDNKDCEMLIKMYYTYFD